MARELAHEVCRLAAELTPPAPPTAIVVTHNYGELGALLLGLLSPERCHDESAVQWRLELDPQEESPADWHRCTVELHTLDANKLDVHTHTEGKCRQFGCFYSTPHEHISLHLFDSLLQKRVKNPTREPSWSKPAAKEAAAAAAASPDAPCLRAEATRQMRSAVVDAIQQGLRYRGRVPLELGAGGETAAGGGM
eukprot:scaffold3.g6544.t1